MATVAEPNSEFRQRVQEQAKLSIASKTLEDIRKRSSAIEASRSADYEALVAQLASGTAVDPAKAAELLDQCRKTADDLAHDVEIRKSRLRDAELVAKRDAAESELAAAQRQLAEGMEGTRAAGLDKATVTAKFEQAKKTTDSISEALQAMVDRNE